MIEKLNIPKLITPKKSIINNKKIPRIIFQTFETSSTPIRMYKVAMSWIEYNQEYEYRFYDNEDRITFIKQNFNPQVLEAYYLLDEGAFRADLWRYCVLYTYGGVYADIDTTCKIPLTEIIQDNDEFIASKGPMKNSEVLNGFICSIPKHPFLKKAIDRTVELTLSKTLIRNYDVVGPVGLTISMNLYLNRNAEHHFEVGTHYINNTHFRLLQLLHGKEVKDHRIIDGNKTILLTKYEGYLEDLKLMSINHWRKTRVKRKIKKLLNLFRRP